MLHLKTTIKKLDKLRGGYCYFAISKEHIDTFEKKGKTRFTCTIDENYSFPCGLNHLGHGHYFIMLTKERITSIKKEEGDSIEVQLEEDTSELGVEMPEVLEILLEQDSRLQSKFSQLTPGKKRSIIFQILKIKDLNKQVAKAIELIDTLDV